MVTHLFNGMSGMHHRDYGMALAAMVDDRLTAGLIADGIHVSESALRLAVRAKGADNIALVTDSVAWRSREGGLGGSAGVVRMTLVDGAPRLDDGTLAGSCLTMDAAVRNVVNRCGVSLVDAITMASATPARLIGESAAGGSNLGFRADLVALDRDLNVCEVWIGGCPGAVTPRSSVPSPRCRSSPHCLSRISSCAKRRASQPASTSPGRCSRWRRPSPVPVTIDPHLVALIFCPATSEATACSRSSSARAATKTPSRSPATSARSPSSPESSRIAWSTANSSSPSTARSSPIAGSITDRGISCRSPCCPPV